MALLEERPMQQDGKCMECNAIYRLACGDNFNCSGRTVVLFDVVEALKYCQARAGDALAA